MRIRAQIYQTRIETNLAGYDACNAKPLTSGEDAVPQKPHIRHLPKQIVEEDDRMPANQPKPIIGAVTIGQAPRTDVTPDVLPLLDNSFELIQAGALDSVTDFESIAPEPGDYVLVSRLRDGRSVPMAERKIIPHVQQAIARLEEQGASSIMMWCTGEFPMPLRANVPVLYPSRLLSRTVSAIAPRRLAVVIPDASQIEQTRAQWLHSVDDVCVYAANPYDEHDSLAAALDRAADAARELRADLAVLDCIGFSLEGKRRFRERSGIPTILPRTLLARVVQELA